ncbi:MAG: hypothetical protein NW201_04870 [Gemmatimonadales bacterium]|nr:hypothetical protein [Gemmatimonadales bacterium]
MPDARPVADGFLALDADAATATLASRWLPAAHRAASPPTVRLTLAAPGPLPPATDSPPTLSLGGIAAWLPGAGAPVTLAGRHAGGALATDARSATLVTGGDDDEGYSLLTLAAALALAAHGRLLLHAAALVDPLGRGWLLAADARHGKTTTALNLARAGWTLVSDDQVVLMAGDAAPHALAWRRYAHVDEGWGDGRITGHRVAADASTLGVALGDGCGVHGMLLPRIEADAPTALTEASGADALAALIRQAPWVLASPAWAPALLALATAAARAPAWHLRLGRDTYADPPRLAALVSAASPPTAPRAGPPPG